MPRTPDRFQEFARIGAAVRLSQLHEEERQIYKAFPSLRFKKRGPVGPKGAEDGDAKAVARRRKRRALTPAEKKAISDRMKKYWADRKKKS
jgi:hypothetical protein